MNRKIDQLFIKIQWFIILIAGIFLLLHGTYQNLVIIIWIFSILCNAFWAFNFYYWTSFVFKEQK